MPKKRETGESNTPPAQRTVDFSAFNFVREAHNYLYRAKQGNASVDDLNQLNDYVLNHLLTPREEPKKYKVGVVFVSINFPYWQYMKPVIEGVRQFFLPGHDVEIMCWSDMPNYPEAKDVNYGATIFPVASVEWPYPTLMRYHLFLKQEEYLKKFDYIFYLDLDMRVVNVVGDEILGQGLTAAPHPGYYISRKIIPPYEPNPDSEAFIKRPGYISVDEGKPRFIPFYAAGGFQGGTTTEFIEAMKVMRDGIDQDLAKGYIAVWNDESHWNKYLSDHPAAVYLDPSYVYPDSLIADYYVPKVWGRDFTPRIITITKPFSLSKEGGQFLKQELGI